MTFNKLLKTLDAHGIVYEMAGAQAVRTYTEANSNSYDVIERKENCLFLNGSPDFNILEWLGY